MRTILLFLTTFLSSNNTHSTPALNVYSTLTSVFQHQLPMDFKPELTPENKIIHRGVFTPSLDAYYYTLSNKDFTQFEVWVIQRVNNAWTSPKKAFFDTKYDEHGMSFSSDGQTIYFASTRPVGIEGVPHTWHIWKSERKDNIWTEPQFVDIPTMQNKLVSHPTVSASGELYFHASGLDYSQMDIYYCQLGKDGIGGPEKVFQNQESPIGRCTPFIDPNGRFLLFASIGEQLDLHISYKDENNQWTRPKNLGKDINTNGQGNPFVSSDHNYLLFASGNHEDKKWTVKSIDFNSILEK
ncbi:MAG: hypothetical protein P1U56_05835 [Saprospiraceae bacterium]|nr:hypothetical protein [Saprospiraceae bacterium]